MISQTEIRFSRGPQGYILTLGCVRRYWPRPGQPFPPALGSFIGPEPAWAPCLPITTCGKPLPITITISPTHLPPLRKVLPLSLSRGQRVSGGPLTAGPTPGHGSLPFVHLMHQVNMGLSKARFSWRKGISDHTWASGCVPRTQKRVPNLVAWHRRVNTCH